MGDVTHPSATAPPPLSPEHPDVPLARLFAIAYRHLVVGLHEHLVARGWRDVRPHYGYVLLACRDEPTTSGELATLLGVSKQAASKLVDGMVEASLVRRTTSREDSRAKLVALTPRGRRLLAVVEEIYVELEAEWAAVAGRPAVAAVRAGLVTVLTSAYGGVLPPIRPV
jgi:DNA-binding MarR family transcriptional regulator